MKSLLKVLFSISTFFLFTSCVETGIEGAVTLGGQIDRGVDTQIVINKKPTALESFLGAAQTPFDTLITDAKGLFLSGTNYDSGMYEFRYQNVSFPLYLLPGKTLNINIDVTQPAESLEFSGGLKHPNRLIRDQHQKAAAVAQRFEKTQFKSVQHFMRFVDSARKSLDTLVVQFITNHPRTDKNFMQDRQQFNYYFTGNIMLSYYENRKLAGDSIPQKLLDAIHSFPLHRDELLKNAEYLRFARRKIDLLSTSKHPDAFIAHIDSLIPGIKTKSVLALKFAREYTYEADSLIDNEHIHLFSGVITDTEMRERLNKTLERAAAVSPGTSFAGFSGLSPDSTLRSTDGFRGKPLLIFFGVASCPECRYEFEQLRALQEKYAQTGLQMLGVGSSVGFDLWKKHIKRADYPGEALYLNQNTSKVYDQFMISGEPHYMLIGTNGIILSRNVKGDIAKQLAFLLSNPS